MLYIATPCSRPENLLKIQSTIPKECKWIICYDDPFLNLSFLSFDPNIIIIQCEDNGFVGTKARNYILDHILFNDDDHILFHDDDNIIHHELYNSIKSYLNEDFSIMCWGQINKDNSIRFQPSRKPRRYKIDTACYLIKWKYNKHIRHKTDIYYHDGVYAEDCSTNGSILTIDKYLCYYNYLR